MKRTKIIKRITVISLLSIFSLLAFSCTYFYAVLHSIQEKIDIVTRTGDYSVPLHPPESDIIPIDSNTDDTVNTDEPYTEPPIDTQIPTPGKNTNIYKKDPIDPNIWNILLLGKDSYGNEAGRTDAMMILSYNKKTHSIKLISLMRDSLIPIEGHDWDRINTPYNYGGIGFCINTVNDVFDLDIQNYILINLDGIEDLIDKIGGVDIVLTQPEVDHYNYDHGLSLTPGPNTLDGKSALIHARNRSVGNSDFTRTERQREILISLYNKIINENNLSKTLSLVNYSMTKVSTNLSANDMIFLATDALRSGKQQIETSRMPFSGTYQDVWYKKMRVLQIDIEANRKELRTLIYN